MSRRVAKTSKKPLAASCAFEAEENIFSSPVGNIHVTMCEKGLHSVSLERDLTDEKFSPNKRFVGFYGYRYCLFLFSLLENCMQYFNYIDLI